MHIMLNSVNAVKDFVNIVNKYDFDIDLVSGRHVIDAKSIMGIFSLDLTKAVEVIVSEDAHNVKLFLDEIKPFTT